MNPEIAEFLKSLIHGPVAGVPYNRYVRWVENRARVLLQRYIDHQLTFTDAESDAATIIATAPSAEYLARMAELLDIARR